MSNAYGVDERGTMPMNVGQLIEALSHFPSDMYPVCRQDDGTFAPMFVVYDRQLTGDENKYTKLEGLPDFVIAMDTDTGWSLYLQDAEIERID